jgi:hypothetical protein
MHQNGHNLTCSTEILRKTRHLCNNQLKYSIIFFGSLQCKPTRSLYWMILKTLRTYMKKRRKFDVIQKSIYTHMHVLGGECAIAFNEHKLVQVPSAVWSINCTKKLLPVPSAVWRINRTQKIYGSTDWHPWCTQLRQLNMINMMNSSATLSFVTQGSSLSQQPFYSHLPRDESMETNSRWWTAVT